MVDDVSIIEVGPRDGLQNEKAVIATADKLRLIDLLAAAGLRRIEATAFVSARWVPQMADHDVVMRGVIRHKGVVYSALVPNEQGARNAIAASSDELAVFTSASETFARKNINCGIAESFERFKPVIALAHDNGLRVRGYVSCATDCPYEGEIQPDAVAGVVASLDDIGCAEIAVADTLGRGTPERVKAMLQRVLTRVGPERLACHLHDTSGGALANVDVALASGIRTFDAAAGGLGGCPYAPGAAGNLRTGSLVRHLSQLGFRTNVDIVALDVAETYARSMKTVPA
jgi:hydroxymethylglutaryl-CoA lyase